MASFLSVLFVLHAIAFLAAYPLLVSSQEVEDEKDFNYEEKSEKGPKHWGELHKEWGNCSSGRMQSPIDLLDERVEVLPLLGRLSRAYRPAKGVVINRGHDIMDKPYQYRLHDVDGRRKQFSGDRIELLTAVILWDQLKWEGDAGAVFINGTKFFLKQMHWHSPSEHTIDGRTYDLELHMVHESQDKQIAVVGILYKIGRHDTFLFELMDEIKKAADKKDKKEDAGVLDPRGVKIGSRKYYRYMGSLTTPPCTEGVIWTISKKVRTVSREQVNLLRDAVHDGHEKNARPTQPTNGRPVHLYTPRVLSAVQRP